MTKLLPILEKWKADYNFVGSYYVNVGNEPDEDRGTDWAVSAPYYKAILALGNEIGTTGRPSRERTDLLTPEQIKFEFEASRAVIEQQLSNYLGRPFDLINAAAAAGAPKAWRRPRRSRSTSAT
ncbi:hypothetical protein AB5I41_10880 [Sphingomonas sp. MMS24-JH45]